MNAHRTACLTVALGFILAGCAGAVDSLSTSTTTAAATTTVPSGEVAGTVVAGPVCPVETNPPEPGCEDRAVAGAVIAVTRLDGSAVAEVASDEAGRFLLPLPPGAYRLTPQPVEGLMGTPAPLDVSVAAGETIEVVVSYDTGIR